MESELVRILTECDDNTNTIEYILEHYAYAREIHDSKFDPASHTIEELYCALETASYLAADAKYILDDLLIKIGRDVELFYKTYDKVEIDYYQSYPYHNTYRYSPAPDANPFFKRELLLHYGPPPYVSTKLQFIMSDIADIAVDGNVRLLKETLPYIRGRKDVLMSALYNDHVKCLKLLHPTKSEITIEDIAFRDAAQCLKYLVSCYPDILGTDIPFISAGASECLDYVYEHKLVEIKLSIPRHPNCLAVMIKYGFKITQENICQCMRFRLLDTFQEMIKIKDFPITDPELLITACNKNDESYLKLILPDFKEPLPSQIVEKMWAQVYDTRVFNYLIDNGYLLTASAMSRFMGFSDVFDEAIKHIPQTELSSDHCKDAASNGSADQLVALRSRGCPWDERTPIEAARAGSFECLRYAIINGCPYDINVLREVVDPQSQAALYLKLLNPN